MCSRACARRTIPSASCLARPARGKYLEEENKASRGREALINTLKSSGSFDIIANKGDDSMDERMLLETIGKLMDDKLKPIADRLDTVDKRLDTVDKRLDTVDKRLDTVDKRLDAVDKHLDTMDERLDTVDKRLNSMDGRLANLEEDSRITRASVNTLLDWAEEAQVQVQIPLFKKAE